MCKPPNKLEQYLSENGDRIRNFIRQKIYDPGQAEDLLQESVLKALNSYNQLQDESKAIPWFYQIVRNVIADFYRQKDKGGYVHEDCHPDQHLLQEIPDIEAEQTNPCQCYKKVLPIMHTDYAEIIRSLELNNESPDAVAEKLGITRNNLKVKRHRARKQLKKYLMETCGTCAENGCTHCTCAQH